MDQLDSPSSEWTGWFDSEPAVKTAPGVRTATVSGLRDPCSGSSVTVSIIQDQSAVALLGFEQWSFAGDGDAIREIPDFERHVDDGRKVDLQLDVGANERAEARGLHGKAVLAGVDEQEPVLAHVIGRGLECHSRLAVGERDSRGGDN